MSSVQSTVCSRNTARRSVRLSVCLSRKLGLEISFRLRCTSYLLHAGTLLPLRRHTGTKNRRAPFLFLSTRPPNTLPVGLPPVSSCRFLPRRVIVSRKDRCGTDRATGNKTAPSTLLEKLPYTSIARISSMYFTLSRRVLCSRR